MAEPRNFFERAPRSRKKVRSPGGASPNGHDAFTNGKDNSRDENGTPSTVIQVKAGELHLLATSGEAALSSAGLPIYQRGYNLVQPVWHSVAASNDRTTITAKLKDLNLPMMLDRLSEAASWEKWNARQKASRIL